MVKNFIIKVAVFLTIITGSHLAAMERKKAHQSFIPKKLFEALENLNLYAAVGQQPKYKNLKTQIQIDIDADSKNKAGLTPKWEDALKTININPKLYALDSTVILCINITQATKEIKKFLRPVFFAKYIKLVRSGKMTSPFSKPQEDPAPKNSSWLASTCYFGLAFLLGWVGKTVYTSYTK